MGRRFGWAGPSAESWEGGHSVSYRLDGLFSGLDSPLEQRPTEGEWRRPERKQQLAVGVASWRFFGPGHGLAGSPGTYPPHLLVTPRTEVAARLAEGFVGRWFHLRRQRRLPGSLLCRRQHGIFPQQGPHPVGPHFGRRMQPTEGPHAGEAARQYV